MATKLTRLTHKIAIQLHLMAESCTICSSRSWRPVRKLLDTPSYQYTDLKPLCPYIGGVQHSKTCEYRRVLKSIIVLFLN
jgi:hypothetical protein